MVKGDRSKASNETFCNERAFKKLHHLPMCSVHCLKADASAERLFLAQSQFELFFAIMLAKFLVNYEGLHLLEETKLLNFLKIKQ
jgi:hypothetical protein